VTGVAGQPSHRYAYARFCADTAFSLRRMRGKSIDPA
jgi:hypothetical protein